MCDVGTRSSRRTTARYRSCGSSARLSATLLLVSSELTAALRCSISSLESSGRLPTYWAATRPSLALRLRVELCELADMCGIAGFAGIGLPAQEASGRLRVMCDAIQHRGPDSDGYLVGEDIAMGMRRLSIIDVAGGSQPISNEDGTVTVVFNGEIYNHHQLRRELTAAGHHFATRSATEVLVHLYESHGPDMLRHLHGMFAFSLWDSRRRRLLLARDRTGMKPLSYALRDGGIVYCSEMRALYAFDRSALRIAPGAVMEYLAFGYVPDPNSIFEGVTKLPPAHFLVWSPGREAHVQRYWSPPLTDGTLRDEAGLVAELRCRLEAAVTSHLESEVPLGAFLSGGTDSSTVVALMCRHAAGRVKTFSIGFAEA